jgi:hypothetical protein
VTYFGMPSSYNTPAGFRITPVAQPTGQFGESLRATPYSTCPHDQVSCAWWTRVPVARRLPCRPRQSAGTRAAWQGCRHLVAKRRRHQLPGRAGQGMLDAVVVSARNCWSAAPASERRGCSPFSPPLSPVDREGDRLRTHAVTDLADSLGCSDAATLRGTTNEGKRRHAPAWK